MNAFLPDETRISQVHLRVANLERSLAFYDGVLGLGVSNSIGPNASLSVSGDAPPLITLTEDLKATPRPEHATGLYHFAIRYPTRRDLAHACLRLVKSDYAFDGASEHGVSEAIYLSDPDGNGVELCADRPRSQWQWRNGQITMTTQPLDLAGLLAAAEGRPEATAMPPQTDLGHIHLHVGDLTKAERFYRDYLGFGVTQRSYQGALFFAAGGYHHQLGVNTWAGKAAPPANAAGLVSYRLEVPEGELLYCLGHRAPLLGYESKMDISGEGPDILRIRDPNGTWLEVESTKPAHGCAGIVPRMKRQLRSAAGFFQST